MVLANDEEPTQPLAKSLLRRIAMTCDFGLALWMGFATVFGIVDFLTPSEIRCGGYEVPVMTISVTLLLTFGIAGIALLRSWRGAWAYQALPVVAAVSVGALWFFILLR